MSGPRGPFLVLLAATLASAACGGSRSAARNGGLPVCEVEARVPTGFELAATERVEEADHVGVRETYRGGSGRLLHFTAGISGEFGEGAPVVEAMTLATGDVARLVGGGTDWTLVWEGPPPCEQRTVGGNGFQRAEFLGVLRSSGLLASQA